MYLSTVHVGLIVADSNPFYCIISCYLVCVAESIQMDFPSSSSFVSSIRTFLIGLVYMPLK